MRNVELYDSLPAELSLLLLTNKKHEESDQRIFIGMERRIN